MKLSKFLFSILSSIRKKLTPIEFRQMKHFVRKGWIFRWFHVRKALKKSGEIKLQVGGGKHVLTDWINGDLIHGDIYLDATKRLPFPDGSVDYVFAEQFIEHIGHLDGKKFLKEVYRVLKSDGAIRLSTPDLDRLATMYLRQNEKVKIESAIARHKRNHNPEVATSAEFINDIFRLWGHQFIYDEETLSRDIEMSGFKKFSRYSFGESEIADFQGLERHADEEWMKDGFQLIIEAEKVGV
ncbi:class I SAM-dependent methyltransferase [Reichenbachiella versicolor]|uniref:class I SAM-dependent methyltransferase n=1 Tax=Reichenbachiella versicolor TaxID=1821036 RepID=UPI000D6E6F2D|nr:methyltransferase domain-containing protein [Reichenbachiella versicolor]